MQVEKGKAHLLDAYLVMPPQVDMRKAVNIWDMVDVDFVLKFESLYHTFCLRIPIRYHTKIVLY